MLSLRFFCFPSVTWLQDENLKNDGAIMHLFWCSGVLCHGLRLERVGHVLGVVNGILDSDFSRKCHSLCEQGVREKYIEEK